MKKLLTILGVLTSTTVAFADEGRGFYIGGFAGAGRSDNQNVEQTGTAHKYGDNGGYGYGGHNYDFDLAVDVKGAAKRDTAGLGGVQLGYEWGTTSFGIKPAIELEAYYVGADQKSNLSNPNDEVVTLRSTAPDSYTNLSDTHYGGVDQPANTPDYNYLVGANSSVKTASFQGAIQEYANHHYGAGDHRFENKMKMDAGVFMANAVLTYETDFILKPYIGAGIGFAVSHMNDASSRQTSPAGATGYEMSGGDGGVPVNHFNSRTSAYDVSFASQVKLGVRAQMDKHISVFAEYRYLHVQASDYTFGSTVYPDHSATDNWNYKSDSMDFHNALAGIQYAF